MAKHHKTPKGLPKLKKLRVIDEWRAAFRAFFDRKKMRTGKKWGNL